MSTLCSWSYGTIGAPMRHSKPINRLQHRGLQKGAMCLLLFLGGCTIMCLYSLITAPLDLASVSAFLTIYGEMGSSISFYFLRHESVHKVDNFLWVSINFGAKLCFSASNFNTLCHRNAFGPTRDPVGIATVRI